MRGFLAKSSAIWAAGARGCAALWPAEPGVHVITTPARGQAPAQSFALLVLPRAALAGIAARETGAETLRWAMAQTRPAASDRPEQRAVGDLGLDAELLGVERGPGQQVVADRAAGEHRDLRR